MVVCGGGGERKKDVLFFYRTNRGRGNYKSRREKKYFSRDNKQAQSHTSPPHSRKDNFFCFRILNNKQTNNTMGNTLDTPLPKSLNERVDYIAQHGELDPQSCIDMLGMSDTVDKLEADGKLEEFENSTIKFWSFDALKKALYAEKAFDRYHETPEATADFDRTIAAFADKVFVVSESAGADKFIWQQVRENNTVAQMPEPLQIAFGIALLECIGTKYTFVTTAAADDATKPEEEEKEQQQEQHQQI
jgi:hypothetical protein